MKIFLSRVQNTKHQMKRLTCMSVAAQWLILLPMMLKVMDMMPTMADKILYKVRVLTSFARLIVEVCRPSDWDVNWMTPVQKESLLCRLNKHTAITAFILQT